MNEVLQSPETVQQIRLNKFLLIGIAASVILHLAGGFLLLGLPPGVSAPSPSVTYVDLGAMLHHAPPPPMTLPPRQAPDKVEEPQPKPPEELPVPEHLPAQAEQAAAQPAPQADAPRLRGDEDRPHSIMGLGLTRGYFKSLAEGESLRAGVRGYYLEMLQVINEKWWLDQQGDKVRLAPIVVSITIARDGRIVGGQILRSSGNRQFDKAVLASLTAAGPLPPLPASYDGEFFQAPIRLVPPLDLLAW